MLLLCNVQQQPYAHMLLKLTLRADTSAHPAEKHPICLVGMSVQNTHNKLSMAASFMQRLCFKFYLKHWVVPQAVLGFTTVIQLVLTWELVVSHILPGNNPPAPFLLAEPPNE